MQEASLESFKRELDEIKEYINHIGLIDKIEREGRVNRKNLSGKNKTRDYKKKNKALIEFSAHLNEIRIAKKTFEYKSIIISLYGVIERYIGFWLREHISNLPEIVPNYSSFSNKFRENHFSLSIKLMTLISEGRFSMNEDLRKEDVLVRLNNCLHHTDDGDYELNSDAFLPQSGNLKHSKIVEAFRSLEIELNTNLKDDYDFSMLLKEKFGEKFTQKGEGVYRLIDELVDRRNVIAHGGQVDEILNATEFDEYFEFIDSYGNAIFSVLEKTENKFEAEHKFKKIENIVKIINSKICCFEIENSEIEVGDYIIINTNKSFVKKEIRTIQLEGKDYNHLKIREKCNIGIEIDGGLKDNRDVYRLDRPF